MRSRPGIGWTMAHGPRGRSPRPLDLPNLPSGEHAITVQARGPLAQVDDPGYTLRFTVPPPFYLRPAFLIPVGVLTALSASSWQSRISWKKREHSRQLRERDVRLRAVVDQQSELIVRVLPDGVLSFVNGAVCRILRRSAEDLIGQRFTAAFRNDGPTDTLATALGHRSRWRITRGWMRRASPAMGGKCGSAGSPGPSRTAAVSYGSSRSSGRDITDTKIAEQDLLRSEERYRITAEATGQLVYDYDTAHGADLLAGGGHGGHGLHTRRVPIGRSRPVGSNGPS